MSLRPWSELVDRLHQGPELRVLAVDMDGTLLDENSEVPHGFAQAAVRLRELGVSIVPASGRQLATLKQTLPESEGMSFIAENGAMVEHKGDILATNGVSREIAADVIDLVRHLQSTGWDLGLVLCGTHAAYMESVDSDHLREARKYYVQLEHIEDLHRYTGDVLKLAIYAPEGSEPVAAGPLAELTGPHRPVVSAPHWVDIMGATTNKGAALDSLMNALDIEPESVVAVGDYHNDLEMLQVAGIACCVANAHSGVKEHADFEIPSNVDHGVVQLMHAMASARCCSA